jgi:plastocyanin
MAWRMRLHVIQHVVAVCGLLTVAACAKGEEKGGAPKAQPEATAPTPTASEPASAGSSASNYKEVDSVENAGALKGTVSYAGTKKAPPLDITKDTNICTHGGEPDGSLEVNDGKVKNAVVAITDPIEQGKKWEADRVAVDNKECAFVPRVQVARQGGKIDATNSDQLLHNTNLSIKESGKTLANVALPVPGMKQTKDLKDAGLIEVKCDVHPWMRAWIYVSPHPYAAVTGDDGTFEITDVPAGEYNAKVWHESLGEAAVKVKVDPGGTATLDHAFK